MVECCFQIEYICTILSYLPQRDLLLLRVIVKSLFCFHFFQNSYTSQYIHSTMYDSHHSQNNFQVIV